MNRVFSFLCPKASVALLISFFITSNMAAQEQTDYSAAHESQASARSAVSEPNEGAVAPTVAPTLFRNPILALIGSAPEALTVADLDKNGYLDLVTALQNANGSDGQVSVALGGPFSVFDLPVYYDSGGKWASSVAVADVNNDGKPDIVVANYGCSPENCVETTVGVLLGNGDGTFQPAVTYNLNASLPLGVVVGDLNNDGKPDIIVAAFQGIIVLLGNGDGTFQSAVSYPAGQGFQAIAAGDLNGDHNIDIVTYSSAGLVVFLGKGDGTFQAPAFYASGVKSGGWSPAVAIGDLNGDGSLDIAAANYPDGTVGVLLNHGDGTFAPAVLYGTGAANAWSLAIDDVTGDLKPDLAVVNFSGSVSVLAGNGDGTFQSPLMFSENYSGGNNSIVIADINKDVVSDGEAYADIFLNLAPTIVTTTTLVSSPNPARIGQAVKFRATVSSSAGPPPNGELVTFRLGTTVLGTAPLRAGTASLIVDSLPEGKHKIVARYPGDSDFLVPSNSPALIQVIRP